MPSEESKDSPLPEIHIDEDWKSRVKAEDAALEARLKAEAAARDQEKSQSADDPKAKAATSESENAEPARPKLKAGQLPPADIGTLIGMLTTQAMVALGLLPHPVTAKADVEPALAQHFIDLLAVLQEKTTGNLSQAEAAALENTLHELRMAYVKGGLRPET